MEKEYLAKARMADGGMMQGATNDYSDSDLGGDEGDLASSSPTLAHTLGPVEAKLRAHPAPVGLCFGAYGEGSQGVHDLVDNIAHKMAEERGEELGTTPPDARE